MNKTLFKLESSTKMKTDSSRVTSDSIKALFVKMMLDWYKTNRRSYLWRVQSGPYEVFVSEIMLQQTNADKVLPVYQMFTEKYPNVKALALAETDELEAILAPLGLRYRAGRLKKIATLILSDFNGEVPHTTEVLLTLPGIGRYIAGAILCFAYRERVALVDTNTLRIYSRVFGIQSQRSRPREDHLMWAFAENMLPPVDFQDYNRALIDFGSKICLNKSPKCNECINKFICHSYTNKQ